MRSPAFQPFVTTVGADGTLVIPLTDASNAGITVLIVGPGYKRNGVRYFVKMPDLKEARRNLPVPIGYNRDSVTFEPKALVVSAPLPAHCTIAFVRIRHGSEKGKITKKAAHLWSPLDETALYPAATIQIPPLSPGETLDIEGTTYWFNDRNYRKRQSKSPLHIPHPPEPPPEVKSLLPGSFQLLVKLHWLPNELRKRSFTYVSGSPLGGTPQSGSVGTEPAPTFVDPEEEPD